jgi:hypothetical protein
MEMYHSFDDTSYGPYYTVSVLTGLLQSSDLGLGLGQFLAQDGAEVAPAATSVIATPIEASVKASIAAEASVKAFVAIESAIKSSSAATREAGIPLEITSGEASLVRYRVHPAKAAARAAVAQLSLGEAHGRGHQQKGAGQLHDEVKSIFP